VVPFHADTTKRILTVLLSQPGLVKKPEDSQKQTGGDGGEKSFWAHDL